MNAPTIQRFAVGEQVVINTVPGPDETVESIEKRGFYKACFPGTYVVLEDVSSEDEDQVVKLGYGDNSGPVMVQYGEDPPEPLELSSSWLAPAA